MTAAIQWLALASQIMNGGEALWNKIKGVLAEHGIEADTSTLDGIIADAARRRAMAEADAKGPRANGD